MEWKDLTVEDLRVNMTRAANWKSPGPDRLSNFWIKQFKSLHKPMADQGPIANSRLDSRRHHQLATYEGRNMDP